MSGKKVYEDLCYNEMKMEEVKFVFKIREFSKRRGCVKSCVFPSSAPEEVGKWFLQLETNSRQGKDVTIEIVQQTTTVEEAIVIFSLINDKGSVLKDYVVQYSRGGFSSCSVRLVDHDYVLYKANGLLRDDELTLVCRIQIKLPDVVSRHSLVPAKCEPPPCRLVEDLGELLASGTLSDVTIMAGGAELKAHKAVLAARSAVFAAMFSNPMLENETGVIQITDLDADVVQAMLEFMYTGKYVSQEATRWAHNLFAAATKYQLERLRFICEETLCKAVTLDNVLENLALADLHSAARLKAQCISLVREHRATILTSPSWDTFIRSHHSIVTEIMETNSVQE